MKTLSKFGKNQGLPSKRMELAKHLQESFEKAESEVSNLPEEILEMEGMSGRMTRHFYNNLLSMEGANYLEIGTWKGSSTCSAIYKNKALVYCIDNWSEFFEHEDIKSIFLSNIEKYSGENTVRVMEADCFSVDPKSLPTFNIYLYDGGHTEEEQYKALTHFYPCLEDEFLFICDDWDWAAPRAGTYRAIQDLNLEIVHRVERSLNEGDSWKPRGYAEATWWNGIWAAVLRKRKT